MHIAPFLNTFGIQSAISSNGDNLKQRQNWRTQLKQDFLWSHITNVYET